MRRKAVREGNSEHMFGVKVGLVLEKTDIGAIFFDEKGRVH